MLWLLLALMTAGAILAVLWPLGRRRADAPAPNELAVYRDQLQEIDRDRTAGSIGAAEAEAARVEVSRRLIAAADARQTEVTSGGEEEIAKEMTARLRRRRLAAVAALVAMPVLAGSLYFVLGSPNLPDQPLAGRLETAHGGQSITSLIERVEAHLAQHPDDGRGWEVIAPVYMRLQRFDDAIQARRNALRLLGETADRQSSLGEALLVAADGVVTADAKRAFERAVELDSHDVKARYYLGLAAEQDGKRDEAARIWRELLAGAPEGAPWVELVRAQLAHIGEPPIAPAPGAPAPGPNAQDVAAASQLAPEQRDQMIRTMVERLATRLHEDGSDVEGWLRLVRSYMTLGEREHARAAVDDAHRALVNEPDKIRRLDEGVKGLGLDG
jgi:cytochrome c-type biogenesis protein CcmH